MNNLIPRKPETNPYAPRIEEMPICPPWRASAIAFVVALVALCFGLILVGCAGPSKSRLKVLLSECREQNRERARIIKAYEQSHCIVHPEQESGKLGFDEAGY